MRVRQVLAFCQPVRDESPLGFKFERVDGDRLTDKDTGPTRALEEFLLNSGDEPDPIKRERLRRGTFKQFITRYVWDTLSADACPIEMVQTANGKLSGYYNLDFETIRNPSVLPVIEEGYPAAARLPLVGLRRGSRCRCVNGTEP